MLFKGFHDTSPQPGEGKTMNRRPWMKAAALAALALLLFSQAARAQEQEEEGRLWPSQALRTEAALESLPMVVLDPGHGGPDAGAVGPGGLTEAELVWTMASGLKLVLERERVARVVLTRSRDENPSLPDRTAVANSQQADLFVSLHLAAAFNPEAKGSAAYLASAQGRSGSVGLDGAPEEPFRPTHRRNPLPQAAPVSWEVVQSPHRDTSHRVCASLLQALEGVGLFVSSGLHEADLPLLHGAAMPACLVELATITHPAEEAALRQESTRQALLDALVKGLRAALEEAP